MGKDREIQAGTQVRFTDRERQSTERQTHVEKERKVQRQIQRWEERELQTETERLYREI